MNTAFDGVTVAIPTLDRSDCLIETIKDLLNQTYKPIEILVVDQSSEPAAKVLQFMYGHPTTVTYCRIPVKGLPNARNFAWQKARHSLVIFVDDDIRCGRDFVKEHVYSYTDASIGAVAGGIDEKNGNDHRSTKKALYNSWTATPTRAFSARGIFEVDHPQGCNFSVLKSEIQLVGGFDERLNYGAALYEEAEFALRLKRSGKKILFNGNARLTHLAVRDGGCRVKHIEKYTKALVHNRCILIFRYSKWFQIPIALARLWLLIFSYALAYEKISVLIQAPKEILDGFKDARSTRCITPLHGYYRE